MNLKFEDVDSFKGRKNCYTLLSDVTFQILRGCWEKEKSGKWLFPNWNKEKHIITTRIVQKILQDACKKAGIKKKVDVYSLRHSFAAHLLESRVDLGYIQKLLCHKSLKTTKIYTQVSTKDLLSIKSPPDGLLEGGRT